MVDVTAQLAIQVLSVGIDDANRQLDRLNRTAGRAERQAERTASATERMARTYQRMAATLAALGVARLVGEFVSMADAMTRLEGQLRLVTGSTQELARAQADLFDLAQETRSSYEATVSLYTRLARSTESLALGHDRLLRISETVNKSIQVGGSTAQEAASGVIQFGQALASGTLRGDELRSVLENMPALTRILKDGLEEQGLAGAAETAVGALRRLASEGVLNTEVLIEALESQAEKVDALFARLPRTVEQAMTQMRNDILRAVDQIDEASGFTDSLNRMFDSIGQLVQDPAFQGALTTIMAILGRMIDVLSFVIRNWELFMLLLIAVAPPLTKLAAGFTLIVGKLSEWLDLMNSGVDVHRLYSETISDINAALETGVLKTEAEIQAKLALAEVTRANISVSLAFAQAKLIEAQAFEAFAAVVGRVTGEKTPVEAAQANITALQDQLASIDQLIERLGSYKLGGAGSGGGGGSGSGKEDPFAKLIQGMREALFLSDTLEKQLAATSTAEQRKYEIALRLQEHEIDLLHQKRELTEGERTRLRSLIEAQIDAENRVQALRDADQRKEEALQDARRKSVEALEYEMRRQEEIGREVSTTFQGLFRSIIDGSFTAADALSKLADMLMRVVELAVFGDKGFGGFFAQIISGGLGLLGGGPGAATQVGTSLPAVYAKGGVFGPHGEITAFARGGIVDRPTLFPFERGGVMQTGLMGEAGKEGILPLAQMGDGSLGVMAQIGGGGAAPLIAGNLVVNVESSGDETPEEQAQRIGKAIRVEIDALIDQRMTQQLRPGGILYSAAYDR